MIYFYARVSTKEQNLARQLESARAYKDEIDEIFCDKVSGKSFKRPEYERMKNTVVKGDEIVVKELDRLGRNKELIKEELKWFKEQGVFVRVLDLPTTLMEFPTGQEWVFEMVNNILIEVLSAMAEQEKEKTNRRIKEGIAAMPVVDGKRVSTKTGNCMGRSEKITDSEFQKILKKQKDSHMTVTECCRELGISRTAWYKRVAEVA
jgi:DNA invertase Pin-like site-specific DNA recombinase